jgi:hypothetical protein
MSGWRVAVLGNSHAASLGLGWKAAKGSIAGILSLSVFARPNGQGGLEGLQLKDGVIEGDSPQLRQSFVQTAGVDRIELRQFDAFLIHSFGPEPRLIYGAAASLEGHHYSAGLMRAYQADYRRDVKERYDQSPITLLARLIRSGTQAPVYATHKPLFAENIPELGRPYQAGALSYATYQEAVRESLADAGCQLLPQPPDTIVGGCFTAARFAKGDFMHMDGDYGYRVLKALAAALGDKPD